MPVVGEIGCKPAVLANLIAPLLLSVACAAVAQAADVSSGTRVIHEPPSTYGSYSWTGLYAGATIGYGWQRDHLTEYLTATGAPTGLVYDFTPNGMTAGVKAGGTLQTGPIVFGVEADWESGRISGGFVDAPIGSGRDDVRWQASLRGRVGFAFDRFLIHGTGGLALARTHNLYTFLPTGVSETVTRTKTGWTIGGGVDYAVTDNWIAGVDYRHTDLGTTTNISRVAFPGLTGGHRLTSESLRLSLSYKY